MSFQKLPSVKQDRGIQENFMMEYLQYENVWLNKSLYEDAEIKYYENLAKAPVTPLAGEVAKARQLLIESRDTFKEVPRSDSVDAGAVKFFEKKIVEIEKTVDKILERVNALETRFKSIEKGASKVEGATNNQVHEINVSGNPTKDEDEDDGVDLFGSDSEEENETAAKLREERLAAYNAKKSKKPVLIAKSNVILDVKPWDDETDMKVMEQSVRKIESEGLLWGAAKLVPLAYGIKKLQISCVVEDDKVSIDWLTEEIQGLEDFVQSVDIAAFNKI